MTQRNSPDDKLIISASKYIIWSYVVYLFNILLVVVYVLCQTFNFFPPVAIVVEAASAILLSVYGIANASMFIYFHPKYIDRVKSIFRVFTRTNRVIRPGDIN